MAKGKFKAQIWKGWIEKKRYERFEGSELVVGVDCAKKAFYAAVMAHSWLTFDLLYFEREEIVDFVQSMRALPFDRITLVFEPTGTYSDVLIHQARQVGLEVVRINGSRVNSAAEVFDGVPSLHDGKAAYLLARLHLSDVGSPWTPRSGEEREIRALVNTEQVLDSLVHRLYGPLEAYLARHWPELTGLLDLGSTTLLELLSTYGSPRAVADDGEGARRLMHRVGGSLLKPEKVEAVLRSAAGTAGLEVTEHEREMMRFLAGAALDLKRRGQPLKRLIEKTAQSDARIRPLCRFAGKRTALVIVAYLGALSEYESSAGLTKAFGLNLCERSTGQTRQDRQATPRGLHVSKRGATRPRAMLFFLAMRMLNERSASYCPVATAWYGERLRRNGGNKLKALVALMRKLTAALWHLARGASYDPSKLFDVERLVRLGHLSPAAVQARAAVG